MPEITCHMCGKVGERSKEHHFPKWMRKYHPIVNAKSFNFATGKISGKDVGVKTINIICKSCNGGWMATLQEQAKPILVPLLEGKSHVLDRDEQAVLSRWYAMFTAVNEADNPAGVYTIPLAERIALTSGKPLPPDWRIWIGRHNLTVNGGRGVSHLPDRPGTAARLVQRTAAIFGDLIFLSISGPADLRGVALLPHWGMNLIYPTDDVLDLSLTPKFPSPFHPRILADVAEGVFEKPAAAAGMYMGVRPFYAPPSGF